MAAIKYIAYLSRNPEELAKFYHRFFQTWEVGRSSAGDVSITDGFFNLALFKKRTALGELRRQGGLNHIGIGVESIEEVKSKYLKMFPRGAVIPEAGGIHRGVLRIHDPDGNPVSLSERSFGVAAERKVPGIRHIAYNAMDPDRMQEFYTEVFGFVEIASGLDYRQAGKPQRAVGDGFTNLAIQPFYNSAAAGHEMKFGISHIGFLVNDLKKTADDLTGAVKIQKRPEDPPCAEFRVTDPEGNPLDLSQQKGWEVGVDSWERIDA